MHYLFLSKPSVVYKKQYIDMIREWKKSSEDMVPWVLKLDYADFDKLLINLENLSRGVNLLKEQASCSTFWLMRNDGKMIGAVNIRHNLNPYLFEYGGHIGYGIRPLERRKGNGKAILKLALVEAKRMGIHKVRITCHDNNAASEKVILSNGGVFDSKGVEGGNIIKRFWIRNE